MVFNHPPLEGEVSRAERGTEGRHPHDGGTPLRLASGQPPPLPGEDEGFAAAVGHFQTQNAVCPESVEGRTASSESRLEDKAGLRQAQPERIFDVC